jgi:hypothetical protein
MQSILTVLDDKMVSLEEIVRRIMANGHSEEFAWDCAESYSVVFKYGLEEPITRRYLHIQIELLENRSKRYWNELREEMFSRLDRIEAEIAAVRS